MVFGKPGMDGSHYQWELSEILPDAIQRKITERFFYIY